MSTYYVCIIQNSKTLYLHVPSSWTVGRMKELILLYHPETPSIRSQMLKYNDRVMQSPCLLSEIFSKDNKPEVYLSIETVPEPPAHLVGYNSELFKLREEEYIKKYDIARQLLIDTHHKSQDSSLIPKFSIINTLPLLNPETSKRIKFISHDDKPRKIRLRKLPFWIYFDLLTIFRWVIFTVIARMYLGAEIPNIYYAFIFTCYTVNIRMKIENHREKELRKLPRDYLMKILPERYGARRENGRQKSVIYLVFEIGRGFGASLLPWFDPVAYANHRNTLYN